MKAWDWSPWDTKKNNNVVTAISSINSDNSTIEMTARPVESSMGTDRLTTIVRVEIVTAYPKDGE